MNKELRPKARVAKGESLDALGDEAQGGRGAIFDGYPRTAAQAEALVRDSGLNWTIFQPSLIFGPGDDFFGRVLRELVSNGVDAIAKRRMAAMTKAHVSSEGATAEPTPSDTAIPRSVHA